MIVIFLAITAVFPKFVSALTLDELIADSNAIKTNAGIEGLVRQSFADIPVMIEIARCESGFRQFNNKGEVLYGGGGEVIGIYQIHEKIHTQTAQSLGYDIRSANGNINYARYLYERQGTDPWMAAFSCWGKTAPQAAVQTQTDPAPTTTPVTAPPTTTAIQLTKDLAFGMTDPEILTLQKYLNSIGYTVAKTGIGSAGKETDSFGPLTRNAIRRFQCDQHIACGGNESTTGYGMLNTKTRLALLSYTPKTNSPASTVAFGLNRDLKLWMTGADVTYLQNFLQQRGQFTGTPTGQFDQATQDAVIQFQKSYNIFPQHGYVGPKTKGKIKQLLGL